MSIRARLLLLVLFATLIPALVAGMLVFEHRQSEIAGARQNLAAATRQVALDLTDTIRSTAQLHYGLSRARDFDTRDPTACSVFLAEVLKAHPQYTGILTIKPNGELFCDSLRTGRRLILTDRKYFNDALGPAGPLAVEPVFGRLTGIAVLQIAYAAKNDAGEPRFVLLASLNLEKYMQARAKSLPRHGAVAAIVDGQGTILTWHPGGDKLRGTSIADTPLFRFARERRGENMRDDIEAGGESRIWSVSTLSGFPEVGLHVLVGVSPKDLLADANRKLYQALTTLALVWGLVFAGAWALVERGVRRQAARIVAAVTRFGAGDYAARIGKPYPSGELGDLMVALDHAFGLMQAQREVIQQLNADLEHRVTERTAQLQSSVKELESFTYTVSHDLRAPLRAIDGFSRILEEDYAPRLDDEGRRLLGVVRGNSRRMSELIDDLLKFSRLGRGSLSNTTIDTRRLVEEIVADLRVPGERAPHLVLGNLPPASGDPMLLKLAWTNLLGNAIKFSGKHERPVVEVSGQENGAHNVYSVKDNGAGFDMQYYNKLFGVFQRLHTEQEFPGTGVGLAIVQRVVALHGGRVWAESKPGEGATFHFSLPKG